MDKICYGCMRVKTGSPFCEHCGYDERTSGSTECLPAGVVLHGRYLIGRRLDYNKFFITYLGLDILQRKTVVVKEYFPASIAARDKNSMHVINLEKKGSHYYDAFKLRFMSEAGSKNVDFRYPAIAQVYAMFAENNTAYIITEYVEGINLRKYVKNLGRPMNAWEVGQTLYTVAIALKNMHQKGLIHWEITPDNLIIQPDGTAKLINFGDAALEYDPQACEIGAHAGAVVLRNGFAPLELYNTRAKRGPWTDMYSLCAVIYYCLTGIVPPTAPEQVMEEKMIDWSLLKDLAPIQLEAMKKGMALKVSDREQSVDEFWARFNSPYVTIPTPYVTPPMEPVRQWPESKATERITTKPAENAWLKKWFGN